MLQMTKISGASIHIVIIKIRSTRTTRFMAGASLFHQCAQNAFVLHELRSKDLVISESLYYNGIKKIVHHNINTSTTPLLKTYVS